MISFKKVASVLASAVMLGSTIAFAAAAYPAPLVEDGQADGAVVYGANAASTDMAAAVGLKDDLNEDVSAVGVSEESVLIEKTNNKLNLGEELDDIKTTALDEDDLPVLLEAGVYEDDNGDEFDFEQEINLADGLELTHFSDKDYKDEDLTIGIALDRDDPVLTYSLIMKDTPEFSTDGPMETTDLTILGKEYYVLAVDDTAAAEEITLLDSASAAIVKEGESVALGGYNIEILALDEDDAKFAVDSKELTVGENNAKKIEEGAYIGVRKIWFYENKDSQVEITVGSGKLKLKQGEEIELNEEDVDGVESTITINGGELEQIDIDWAIDDEAWITEESEIEMPALASVKIAMTDFVTGTDTIEFTASGDDTMEITVPIEDGVATIALATDTDGGDGDYDVNGTSAVKQLVLGDDITDTDIKYDADDAEYFIVSYNDTDEAETYLLSLSFGEDGGDDYVDIYNEVTSSDECTKRELNDDCDIGSLTLTVDSVNESEENATISCDAGTASCDFVTIYSVAGAKIDVPGIAAGDATYDIVITEANEDGDLAQGDGELTVELGFNADLEVEVNDVTATGDPFAGGGLLTDPDNDDIQIGYLETELATMVEYDTSSDQGEVTVSYFGGEAYGMVYVSSTADVSAEAGIVAVTDAEIDSVSDKNLVIVAGSCVNKAAAMVLTGSEAAVCGEAFTDLTNVGAGQYLIKVVASPYNAEKIAVLAAGYNAEDTVNAVDKLKEGDVSMDVGTEMVGPVLA